MSGYVINFVYVCGIILRISCSNCYGAIQVVTPTGNVLVDNLTLSVEPGSNLLITGMVTRSKGVCLILWISLLCFCVSLLFSKVFPGSLCCGENDFA